MRSTHAPLHWLAQAINGLKFDMEPAEDYVNRVLPPAILALSRPLECVRDLALHCVNERPSCRPSAALAATLLESALTLAGGA